MITYGLEGFNDVNDMLCDLGLILGKKVARKSARNALKPVLSKIQQTAPVDNESESGVHLKDSFKISVSGRTKKDQREGNSKFLTAKVISSKEVGQYVAQIEFGRAEGTHTRTNVFGVDVDTYSVTQQARSANPFMADALESQSTQVFNTFSSGIIDEIGAIAQRKQRKARSVFRARERRARQAMRGS